METVEDVIGYLRGHSGLAAADDYELCVHKVNGTQTVRIDEKIQSETLDEHSWVNLRVIQCKQPGMASGFCEDTQSLDQLVSRAVWAAKSSDPDPWFRFPVARSRKEQKMSVLASRGNVDSIEKEAHFKGVSHTHKTWKGRGALARRLEKLEVFYPYAFEKVLIRHSVDRDIIELVDFGSPVFIHARVMSELLAYVARWFYADHLLLGNSPLFGLQGKQLFSPLLQIVDDGCMNRGMFHAPIDIEGVEMGKTVLVENGRVESFLHSSSTAARENRPSTGNLIRNPEELSPAIGATNCYISGGNQDTEIVSKLDGFSLEYLESLEADTKDVKNVYLSGAGRQIRGGSYGEKIMIRKVNCDLMALLRSVVWVGKDVYFCGHFGAPSILFEKMPLSIKR